MRGQYLPLSSPRRTAEQPFAFLPTDNSLHLKQDSLDISLLSHILSTPDLALRPVRFLLKRTANVRRTDSRQYRCTSSANLWSQELAVSTPIRYGRDSSMRLLEQFHTPGVACKMFRVDLEVSYQLP